MYLEMDNHATKQLSSSIVFFNGGYGGGVSPIIEPASYTAFATYALPLSLFFFPHLSRSITITVICLFLIFSFVIGFYLFLVVSYEIVFCFSYWFLLYISNLTKAEILWHLD